MFNPQTAGMPAQQQESQHVHAAVMAHAAAARQHAMRQLHGVPKSPANYKAGIAMATAAQGVPAGLNEIHGAIDQMTQQGQFTPIQAQALKQHNGPLHGRQGAATAQAIAGQVMANAKGVSPQAAPQGQPGGIS